MNNGKRRTESQRIGRVGELEFAAWATSMGLTANKCDEDLGIDYFCQVLDDSGRVGGQILAVQVKATESLARKRVVLTRDDIIAVVRSEYPFCLVGVDLKGKRRIGFRFLDKELLQKFLDFLRGDKDTWSMNFNNLETGGETFKQQIARACSLARC